MPLSDITILITSFLRPGYLAECLKRIKSNLPECPVIVVDDSGGDWSKTKSPLQYGYSTVATHPLAFPQEFIHMTFDSGLTVKRNAGVAACQTKYLLCGSDDFDFGSPEARAGIVKLYATLENNPDVDIAGGRHANNPYEGFMSIEPGKYIKETRLTYKESKPFYQVDLCVNYFLARIETLREVRWDEEIVPIGGEHGQFFLHLKEAGKKVVWVPGVNINPLPYTPSWQHPDYSMYRGRAKDYGHKIFLRKRGVQEYYGFDDPLPVKIVSSDYPATLGKPALIAIMACHRYPQRQANLRNTWLQDLKGMDYRFFLGATNDACRLQYPDEVFLDVPDNYESLPLKVQAACRWALANGYETFFKCDDDTYIVPGRLYNSDITRADYIGRLREPSGNYPAHYASGGPGYALSATAMRIIADAPHNGDWAEDRFIANTLLQHGIRCEHEPRFWLWPWKYGGQTKDPMNFITACDISANLGNNSGLTMPQIHHSFKKTGKLPAAR